MLTRKVDATLGAFWNYEGVQLQRAGKRPHIIRVDQAGVPTYNELVLAARGASRTRAARASAASCSPSPRPTSSCAATPRPASTRW